MIFSKIKKLSDLKSVPDDYCLLQRLAIESGLYPLWLDNEHYRYLSNFLKYRFGIVVRQGYVFCKNDFACRIVIEFTSIPYDNVIIMKGLY
jgi:hypothetical protein